jgi:mannose-6-phosphate isomerase
MPNSDNVLRGGLTPNHVDVDELLRTLTFEGGEPQVLKGEAVSQTERVYRTPAEEFELSRIALDPGTAHAAAARGPEAFIVLEGAAALNGIQMRRGSIAFAHGGAAYRIEAGSPAVLFKAALPVRPS